MSFQQFRLTVLGTLLFAAPDLLAAGYSPTVTEVNIGPVPLDLYTSSATNSSLGYPLPNCPAFYTIRNCYRLFFNNDPSSGPYSSDNYIGQGVTGVRFMFGTAAGGFYSTAWNSEGTVSPTWIANLTAFLSDLHGYGIARVTPTPAIDSFGTVPITPASPVYDCTGSIPLVFYPAIPYGNLS